MTSETAKNLVRVPLGPAGIAYVLNDLTAGNCLCDALLEVVRSAEGDAFTLAPIGTTPERLREFSAGGLLPENLDLSRGVSDGRGGLLVPVVTMVDERARLVHGALSRHAGSVCLVDDCILHWAEPVAREAPTAFGVGEEVYHLLSATTEAATIADVLSMADALWHGVSAVCREPLHLTSDREATQEALRRCARTATQVSCRAYDGEGFVMWQKS